MKWLGTRWPLIVLTGITLLDIVSFGQHYPFTSLRFWNPNDPDSGFHGRLGLNFCVMFLVWIVFGVARGRSLRQHGER